MRKKTNKNITLILLMPLVFSFYTLAEESAQTSDDEVNLFKASAEVGFLYKTGNKRSTDLKVGANLTYETEKWLTSLDLNFLMKEAEETDEITGEKDLVTQDNKWDVTGQSNYNLDEEGKHYLYGNVFYSRDEFSSFSEQASGSVGWGKHYWDEEETWSLFTDIGPGLQYDVKRETDTTPEESTTNVIAQAQVLYLLKLNEHVDFKQHFIFKQAIKSSVNSTYKSETALTAAILNALQVKISFKVDYDSEVEPEFEHINTETSVTLVYNY